MKLKDKYYFLLIKQCIILKSDIILLNTFTNQAYILAVFNENASKVILFWKINRFLRSTTQGSIHRDLIKKWIVIIYPDFNFVYTYTPSWYSHTLPSSPTEIIFYFNFNFTFTVFYLYLIITYSTSVKILIFFEFIKCWTITSCCVWQQVIFEWKLTPAPNNQKIICHGLNFQLPIVKCW